MRLEDQVITLQQAKRLKELGVKQESLFWWTQEKTPSNPNQQYYGYRQENMPWDIFLGKSSRLSGSQVFEEYAAFTVAELGRILPQTISYKKTQKASIKISRFNAWTIFYNRHSSGMNVCMTEDYNECAARSSMLIHLLESKLITAEEVNERL